jgi:hypothetical protein
MKEYRFLLMVFIVLISLTVFMIGCKDEVAQPSTSNYTPITPSLTTIIPANAAVAGVNTITIQGQNFSDSLSDMAVYFNTTQAEILSLSKTSITVRRPNMYDPAAVIKVVSSKAYVAAKVSPYQVDQVLDKYGMFADNINLAGISFNGDTMYAVASNAPYTIWKVTPDGVKTTFIDTVKGGGVPAGIRIHNGTLYWLSGPLLGYYRIYKIDLSTRVLSLYEKSSAQARQTKIADFGPNNYLYASGMTSTFVSAGLFILRPPASASDTSVAPTVVTGYAAEIVRDIRVNGNYCYVASTTTAAPAAKIYRHLIGGSGASLGARELVFDLGKTQFSSRTLKSISFAASGTMYITTEAANPLLVVTSDSTADYFYKEIMSHTVDNAPSYWYGKQSYWGATNNLFMVGYDTTSASVAGADRWNVFKVSMGTAGAAYY